MKKRVLLVDDESSIRRTLSLGLSQEGYNVESCENGICALKTLDTFEKNEIGIDTIILDIQLPDIDGVKLGKMIKAKYPAASMVYITGYADKLDQAQIDNLGASALLEKPFSVEDLTSKFNVVEDVKEVTETPSVETPQDEITTVSSYMFLKLEKDIDFFSMYRELYFMENVLYCDTTKGDYDIFLLVQSNNVEGCMNICEEIKNKEGVKEVDFLEIGNPALDDSMKDIIHTASISLSNDTMNKSGRDLSKRVCSYVLIETSEEKLDEIYTVLSIDENIVTCDYTNGKYNLVLFVHGGYFDEIDKFIENKIVNLDGVLKVKEYPVVNLFDM